MNKIMEKLEDYIMSEQAFNVQFSLFTSTIIVGFFNIIIFDNSFVGGVVIAVMLIIMILDVFLTALVLLYNHTLRDKGGK